MIDLQLHTTDSDGTWPWDKVLDHCLQMKLKAFAITDHDTIVRRNDIVNWAQGKDALVIPGIELSTRDKGETIHLLGYFLDGPLEKLNARLSYLQEGRVHRNGKIIHRLQKQGLDVTEEELREISGKGSPGRPHIARLLFQKGYVKSIADAFNRYLGTDGSAYVPLAKLELREGIELLHGAGAVAVVAHPLLLKRSPEELEMNFKEWGGWGLDGLESYYPTYTVQQTMFMQRITEKYQLLMTGGSDFHGENKPHIKIGTGTGQLNVPDELMAPLLERKNTICKKLVN